MLTRWPEQLLGEMTLLRRCSPHTDLDALTAAWSTPDIAASIHDPLGSLRTLGAAAYSLAFLESAAQRDAAGLGLTVMVASRATGDPVGCATLTRDPQGDGWELGYWTLAGHRNRGLATDAVATLTAWFLGNGASQVWAEAYDRRSASILERCGYAADPGGAPPSRVGSKRYRRLATGVAGQAA